MTDQAKSNDNFIEALLVAIPEPFFIIDENGYYVQVLGGVDRKKYHDGQHLVGKRMHDVMDVKLADVFLAQIKRAIKSGQVINYVYELSAENMKSLESLAGPEGPLWFEAHISPIRKKEGQPRTVVWVAFNITELQNTLMEKDSLIIKLQKALSEIKTLRGFLPICSQCKKIRDDKGFWNQIESYIHNHSEAEFTHSLCPECAKKLYPDLDLSE
jgi:hypothetical protein